jgi:hypothetical protein
MLKVFTLSIALCAAALAGPAAAQKLYKYTDPVTGKVVYTDKLPPEAAGRANEQLNRQGTVVQRTQAAPTPEELAAREAERKRKLEEEVLAKEEKRKNVALLNTYASEKDIDEARERALKSNEEAIKEAERKIADAEKRQKQLAGEAEFYQKKGLPPQLKRDMAQNEVDMKAFGELLEAKRKETAAINAKYDEDRRRYLELTRSPAKPAVAAAPQPAPTPKR